MKTARHASLFVTLLILYFCPLKSICQGTITVEMFTAVSNSGKYVYIGTTYRPYMPTFTPNFNGMANAMAAMQARYNFHHEILTNEYRKLVNLSLVNGVNQQYVDKERPAILKWLNKNYSNIDLAVEANFSNILNYITSFVRQKSINTELRLLNNINKEIERIKQKDPDNYYRSERYSDIRKALQKLQSCTVDQIGAIAWEYGLL